MVERKTSLKKIPSGKKGRKGITSDKVTPGPSTEDECAKITTRDNGSDVGSRKLRKKFENGDAATKGSQFESKLANTRNPRSKAIRKETRAVKSVQKPLQKAHKQGARGRGKSDAAGNLK